MTLIRRGAHANRRVLVALALALLAPLLAPTAAEGPPAPARAAEAHMVWRLDQRSFDPSSGRDTIAQTFTPTSQYYLVQVALSSSDPQDEIFVQLGDNDYDYTQVQSGEQRFFAATHLRAGAMPALRAIADPKHDYGGRTLTYAVRVFSALDVPQSLSGTAASAVPNYLLFQIAQAATYTIHYHLASGSAVLAVANGSQTKKSGKLTGDGGFSVDLTAGPMLAELQQVPGSTAMDWTIVVGIAPAAHDFQPANNASLKLAPETVSVVTDPGAGLLLDRRVVAGSYDASTRRLTYRPARPLAPGLHLLEVMSADGMPATRHAEFLVLPPTTVQPPSHPAGTVDGQAWVRTSTPDGRYGMLMPESWQMAGANGTVVLADKNGAAFAILNERFLSTVVDASELAHKVVSLLPSVFKHLKASGSPTYAGNANGATFSMTVTTPTGSRMTLIGSVLPSPKQFSLLLAFGFADPQQPASVKQLSRVLSSLAAHDEAGVRAARFWSRFAQPGLHLDYPSDWAADFTSPNVTWIAGPRDQAVMIAIGSEYDGPANPSNAGRLGQQVLTYIKSNLHANLEILANQSANGVYRWLGRYTSKDGRTDYVEVGQAVVANGHLESLWGDTSVDQLPANLPVFERCLDSAALYAKVKPSQSFTVVSTVQALRANSPQPASIGQGQTGTSGQTTASDYKKVMQQSRTQYIGFSNLMETAWSGAMNDISAMAGSGDYYMPDYSNY